MKKNNYAISMAAALAALVAVGGIATVSYAQNNAGQDGEKALGSPVQMMKAMGGQGMSAEERADLEARRTEFRLEREIERTTRRAAIADGNYSAWLETVPEDALIRTKVNEANFSRFGEAHDLMEQGRTILRDELGIEPGDMGQKGFGGKMGKMGKMGNNRVGGMFQ